MYTYKHHRDLPCAGDTPWLIDKKKKKKKKKPVGDESQADEGTQDITTAQKPQIVGTGKPLL